MVQILGQGTASLRTSNNPALRTSNPQVGGQQKPREEVKGPHGVVEAQHALEVLGELLLLQPHLADRRDLSHHLRLPRRRRHLAQLLFYQRLHVHELRGRL